MGVLQGIIAGVFAWFVVRCIIGGFYIVNQSERATKTSFGRAERLGDRTTLDDPIAESLDQDERERYRFPQVKVIPPGGPYFKWPWERVHKVSVATMTVNMAWDPESPRANQGGAILEAVTKDQLNTGLTGQIRYRVSERNLYAYIFGVKNPIAHVMGYSFQSCANASPTSRRPPGARPWPPAASAPSRAFRSMTFARTCAT